MLMPGATVASARRFWAVSTEMNIADITLSGSVGIRNRNNEDASRNCSGGNDFATIEIRVGDKTQARIATAIEKIVVITRMLAIRACAASLPSFS